MSHGHRFPLRANCRAVEILGGEDSTAALLKVVSFMPLGVHAIPTVRPVHSDARVNMVPPSDRSVERHGHRSSESYTHERSGMRLEMSQ